MDMFLQNSAPSVDQIFYCLKFTIYLIKYTQIVINYRIYLSKKPLPNLLDFKTLNCLKIIISNLF